MAKIYLRLKPDDAPPVGKPANHRGVIEIETGRGRITVEVSAMGACEITHTARGDNGAPDNAPRMLMTGNINSGRFTHWVNTESAIKKEN